MKDTKDGKVVEPSAKRKEENAYVLEVGTYKLKGKYTTYEETIEVSEAEEQAK